MSKVVPGSKSMIGCRIVYIGTWKSHIAPLGSFQQAEVISAKLLVSSPEAKWKPCLSGERLSFPTNVVSVDQGYAF